ncbi:MAG: DNA replication/repair protein RecF [Cyanobacteria bacterium]|nr:DNA replication/repair protein RecF [Cyanobacteriota bacterium]MDW8200603.1 DNA replication/repair protein RecF [Cyanobacteriota bacterium SKYGB_h_bin112]
MYLKTLSLRQFRNYADQQVDFLAPKTILVGDNAQGKSNLLEAVELLATLRSHRTGRDRDLVQTGASTGQITTLLERDTGLVELAISVRVSGRRTLTRNGETLRRQVDFLGSLSAVQFSSLDLELVRGGPDRRRTWLDTLLIQLEPVYAHILQQYHQVLRQRNALLRGIKGQRWHTHGELDHQPTDSIATQLAPWDAQLAVIGARVIRRRARALYRLAPLAQQWHSAISNSAEVLSLHYAPNVDISAIDGRKVDDPTQVQQAFLEKIQQQAIAEQRQGSTLVGPHRDDVEFLINGTPARQYGSQGQQRTLVLALKLAELTLIEEVVQEPPLLLLDDVLAELDLTRQNQLLEVIHDRFQTLITTTHLGAFDAQWLNSSQVLTVNAGQLQSYR